MVFSWSISLNAFVPSTFIPLSVNYSSLSSFLIIRFDCDSSSLLRFNDVNVVFTLSTSPIAFAPSALILFTVVQSSSLSFYLFPLSYVLDPSTSVWCLVEVFHLKILLPQFQSYRLSFSHHSLFFLIFLNTHNLYSTTSMLYSLEALHSLIWIHHL